MKLYKYNAKEVFIKKKELVFWKVYLPNLIRSLTKLPKG